jgi:hypothetical protein
MDIGVQILTNEEVLMKFLKEYRDYINRTTFIKKGDLEDLSVLDNSFKELYDRDLVNTFVEIYISLYGSGLTREYVNLLDMRLKLNLFETMIRNRNNEETISNDR